MFSNNQQTHPATSSFRNNKTNEGDSKTYGSTKSLQTLNLATGSNQFKGIIPYGEMKNTMDVFNKIFDDSNDIGGHLVRVGTERTDF